MSLPIFLIWITSAGKGIELTVPGGNNSFMVVVHAQGHFVVWLGPEWTAGAKATADEENHTEWLEWWFIYMDVNIHIDGIQGLPKTASAPMEHNAHTKLWYR